MAENTIGATTRYYGPTNHRGSRIRVTVGGQSRFVGFDHAARNAHVQAVTDVVEAFGYTCGSVTYVADSESGRGSVYRVVTV